MNKEYDKISSLIQEFVEKKRIKDKAETELNSISKLIKEQYPNQTIENKLAKLTIYETKTYSIDKEIFEHNAGANNELYNFVSYEPKINDKGKKQYNEGDNSIGIKCTISIAIKTTIK